MSGEMNTSLGNGLANLLLFLFNNEERGNAAVDCLVEGDDLIGTYNGEDLTVEDYSSLGFNIKLELHNDPCKASFCGLIYAAEDLVSIPDPHKVLLNTGWTSAAYARSSEKTRRELARAKGYSLLSQYAGAPIIQSLGLYLLRVTDGMHYKLPSYWTNYERAHFTTKFEIKPVGLATRLLMEEKFSYTIAEQKQLECYFDNCKDLEPIYSSVILSHCTYQQMDYYKRFVHAALSRDLLSHVLSQPLTYIQREMHIANILSDMSKESSHLELPVPDGWLGYF